jgi:glutamine synthetase adenylyltransferase
MPAPSTRAIIARACGFAHWDDLRKALADAQQNIASSWAKICQKNEDKEHAE